jgi:hypothetical protein
MLKKLGSSSELAIMAYHSLQRVLSMEKCTGDDLEDKFITYQYLEKTQHYLQRKQVTMRKKTILTRRRSTLRRATN